MRSGADLDSVRWAAGYLLDLKFGEHGFEEEEMKGRQMIARTEDSARRRARLLKSEKFSE